MTLTHLTYGGGVGEGELKDRTNLTRLRGTCWLRRIPPDEPSTVCLALCFLSLYPSSVLNHAAAGRWSEACFASDRSRPANVRILHEIASSRDRSSEMRKWSYLLPAWVVPTPSCPLGTITTRPVSLANSSMSFSFVLKSPTTMTSGSFWSICCTTWRRSVFSRLRIATSVHERWTISDVSNPYHAMEEGVDKKTAQAVTSACAVS